MEKINLKMKPFNLERALAGDPVVTRSGMCVKEILSFKENITYSVVALIGEEKELETFTKNGQSCEMTEDDNDLFMAPKTTTYYQNIYINLDGEIIGGKIVKMPDEFFREPLLMLNTRIFLKTISINLED